MVTGFMAKLGATGAGKTCPQITIPMAASFYHVQDEANPSPYVGSIDLNSNAAVCKRGRYRVPAQGLVQLMVHNPEQTGIKLFAVPYDFRGMPAKTRTFLRQRTVATFKADAAGAAGVNRCGHNAPKLAYAVHLRFTCTKQGRIFLHEEIQVLFPHRAPDSTQKLTTFTEGPANPTFIPISPVKKLPGRFALLKGVVGLDSITSANSSPTRLYQVSDGIGAKPDPTYAPPLGDAIGPYQHASQCMIGN
jgi:hypothetical protein